MSEEELRNLAIKPEAEPTGSGTAQATAQQEKNFFDEGKAKHERQMAADKAMADAFINKQSMGWLGKFFGSEKHSNNNIAGVLILLCLAMSAATFWGTHADLGNFRSTLLTLAGSCLGYLFGTRDK